MSVRNRPTALLFAASLLVSVASYAAEYSLDFTGAKALDAEVPVLRRAEVAADVGTVPAVAVGDKLNIALFADVAFTLDIVNEAPGFGTTRTFLARLAGGASGTSTILYDEDSTVIEIRDTASMRLCSIAIRDGKVYAEELDITRKEPSHCLDMEISDVADDSSETSGTVGRPTLLKSAATAKAIATDVVAAAPVTVDIMMVFDQGAQEWVAASQKYSSITNFAIAQVAKVNGVLVNTGLHTNYWLRLVDVVAVNARQTAITGNPNLAPMKNAVVGGEEPWDIVATRREASGADLVNLMINTGSRYGNTGYGDITTGSNGDAWAANVNASFTCTSIHAVEVDYTLAHEIGHNMGLGHSDKQKSPGSSGAFTYSRGYYFKANGKNYHTIMAYSQDGYGGNYTETPYYSSPDYTYIENGIDTGVPVGLADKNDCTHALRQTCAYIAKRKATKMPFDSDVIFTPDADRACVIALSSPGGYPIRYTTDGSEPTRTSKLYSEPFLLPSGALTVKAVAVIDADTLGALAEKTYTAAVEMDDYVWLEDDTEGWKWGYWYDKDGENFYCYDWTGCTSETALLAMGGSVNVDTKVNLGTLIADGTRKLEIMATENSLSALNFEALGDTVLTGTNYSFDNWSLYPASTLTLAPGEGKTFAYTKNLSLADSTTTLVFSNGTVNVTAPDSATGCFGNAALHIANGGTLAISGNGWKTGYANTSPLTIDKGGTMRIDVIECIHRPLTLAGGTIEVNAANSFNRALELRDTQVTVTDDSHIKAGNSGGAVMTHTKDFTFDVRKGKTLTIEPKLVSNGNLGLVKTGYGMLQLEKEPQYTGATSISKGTLSVDYSSKGATDAGWTVAKEATLRINEGKQLIIPSLTLKRGASLSLPAASTAPLVVNSNVSLYGVVISLTGSENLTLGARYPLVKSSGTISSAALMSTDSMPELAKGLAWIFEAEDNVLYACVTNEAHLKRNVPFVCNKPSLSLSVPSDSIPRDDYGVKVSSTPLVVDDISATSITLSMQFEVPKGGFGDKGITLCGWNSGENIIRCIINSEGKIDCNFASNSHTSYTTLSPVLENGVHTIDIAYSSVTNKGTHVMLDGELVYDDATLVWSGDDKPVTRVVFGGDVTLGTVGAGLDILACGVIDPASTAPLPCMTISGGSVKYNYFTPKVASVYPLLPHGGYKMNSSAIDATYSGSYDAVSVSVVAAFPVDKVGSIIAMGMGDWVTTQAEYEGNGTFALRYDGYGLEKYPATTINVANPDVSVPHLYTLTYTKNGNLCFYQDGVEILRQETQYINKSWDVSYKFTFGAGCWHPWQTSGDFNSNPMPRFEVYASHIALGTSDRAVSESAVAASIATEEDCPEPPETPAVVDVLVAYDLGAQAYVANKSQTLEEFAAVQIGKMNDVLVTNRLDRFYTYRLAGVCKVDGVYDNIDTAPALIAAGTGPAVSLRAAREIYGADTVTLLVDVTGNTLGNSSPLNYPNDVASQHECAFSVCSIRAVDTGKQHTMIHENAHNMGCGHARAQSIINSPFEYGRGYYFKDGNVTRHTIMAYGGDNDASWYFSTTSKEFGFTLGDKTNNNARVLKETCGEVAKWREGTAIDIDGVEVGGVTWKTSALYPWTVEGDTIRSYNQTEYGNQCTTPLKATIEGPKMLSFKHKSYFGGESVAGNNYSHFDVLLDDSPVLTQTECTNSWTDAQLIIPDGTHEVTFVFSQRFAMNNDKDYKGGTPEADDAVWLKDIAFADVYTVDCPHSSTSDNVEWTFPYNYEAKELDGNLGGIEVVTKGVVETLGFGSTNAVVLSVLAELPEGEKGEIAGCKIEQPAQTWTAGGTFHAFAYSNGDGTFSLGYGTTTNHVTSTADKVSNWTGLHVWTFAFAAQGGAKLYCDGDLLISAGNIQWGGSSIADTVTYGDDPRGGWALTGAKVYAVHSDFGDSDDVFDTVSSSVDKVLSLLDCLSEYADESQATKLALLRIYKDTCSVIGEATGECVLRISEIMPKPTDDRTLNGREGMDVNGLESGWVELENTSDQWADLADYRFIRVNRGKKTDPSGFGNFPSVLIAPKSKFVFYTSERYSNSKDQAVSAFEHGTFDGKPMIFKDYGNILVWGDKVNPKKSPYVRLYYAPGGDSDKGTAVDTVVVPSDLPEGWSIIVGDAAEGEGTRRWMCPTPTRGTANTATTGLTRIGPNVGPLYEKPDQKKTDLASEFAAITPPAIPGTDYTVTLPINAVMNPDGTFAPRDADVIQSIKFVYRKDLDDATLVTNNIDMAAKTTDANWGDQYTATIPSDYFPAAGHLMQWKVLITDGEGTEWTSPSFNNKDDGYEWYGTIVEPGELNSATLPTWHMFASGNHLKQMDVDADKQNRSLVPNQARIAIYDSSTSNYYDYVRIDLRGNTSAGFTKKGHGLRFAKAHPLTMRDIVSGEDIKEIRKTSLISEFADPSFMRQMIAFWLWRKMGNLVPFDFPVRCNLNGEFYQLAFNSERFTDELIEDVYGLDKFGYSYKNVGTMNLATTTAGSIEKKTPDDEDESNISVLTNSLVKPLQLNGANVAHSTSESASLTKFVVKKFDLPAWLNYLASARITQEMDDVWANVCAYYDNPDMLGGVRGKDTWMPLGYDFNLTFGQYYINDLDSNALAGLSATNDWYKSHPLYGGWTIRARKSPSGLLMNGNNGFEAIYQSAKFRRLYLRRLRTLMDQELKEPGTLEGDTPFMSKMREMADLMRADATLDLDKWKDDTTDNAIDVWKNTTRPADMDAGIDDIWYNYVVPRRQHLYVTHSVTNTAKAIGYGSNLNAGIPEAQSPISALAPNISIDNLTALDSEQAEALGVTGQFYDTEVVVIRNDNDEVVDMSGWKLAFSVDFTFPAGTVCDANDSIYIVADRRTYIEAHDTELTDQVIVGNATFAGTGPIALYAADGTLVYSAIPQTNELKYLRLHSFYGNTLNGGDTGEWFTLTNISDSVTLDLADVTVCFLKQGDDHDTTGHCHVTLTNKKGKGDVKPLKSWTARQSDYADKGWTKIQNNKQQITIYDKYGSVCQSLMVEQKKFPLAYGNGGYLVCDSTDASVTKNSQWHAALYELANDGELSEPFSAEDQEVANELVATAKPVLSEEDIAAGLNEQFLQYLMIVAEPVEGSSGQYKAVVVVNPDTVEVPVVGVDESASAEPVEIEDDEGGKTVSISITNAIIGLWYGYEVADELGDASSFENDVPSFKRATDASHTVTGSLRSQASGFFRVKVLSAKPVDP